MPSGRPAARKHSAKRSAHVVSRHHGRFRNKGATRRSRQFKIAGATIRGAAVRKCKMADVDVELLHQPSPPALECAERLGVGQARKAPVQRAVIALTTASE